MKHRILDEARQDHLFLTRDAGKTASINRNAVVAGSMNLDVAIREAVSEALKQTPLSRDQVGLELSRALGRDISKAVLDSWSSETKHDHKLPAAYVGAFCTITRNFNVIGLLCEQLAGTYLPGRETLEMELQKIAGERQQLRSRERLIRELLDTLLRDGK